jgi:hypothetical protein
MSAMLATFLLSFVLLLLVIAGMSVGVLNGRKAISGSCGGLNNGSCELCGGDESCNGDKS